MTRKNLIKYSNITETEILLRVELNDDIPL